MMYNELSLDEYILFTEHSLNRIFLNLDKLFMESDLLEKEYELKLLTENPDIDRLDNFYFEDTDVKKKSDEIDMKKDGLFGSIWKLIKGLIAKVKEFLFGIKKEDLPEKVETHVTVDKLEQNTNTLFQALGQLKAGAKDKAEKLLGFAKKHPVLTASAILLIGKNKVNREWEDAKAYINNVDQRLTEYEQFKIDDNDEEKKGLFKKIMSGIRANVAKAKDVVHYHDEKRKGGEEKLTPKDGTDVAAEQKEVRAKLEKLPELNEYIDSLRQQMDDIPKKISNPDLRVYFNDYINLEDKESSGKLKKGIGGFLNITPKSRDDRFEYGHFGNEEQKLKDLRDLDRDGTVLKAYNHLKKLKEKLKVKEAERDAIYSAAKSHNISIENYFKNSKKDTANKAMSPNNSEKQK